MHRRARERVLCGPMRISRLDLSGFKGIDVRLSWERINVLFGPNDAGKTNILEAVASAFGASTPIRSSGARKPTPFVSALLEFEPQEPDESVLAAALQWDHVPPLFPRLERQTVSSEEAWSSAPSAARLKWAGYESGGRSFTAFPKGEPPPDRTSTDIESIRLRLHGRAMRALRAKFDDPSIQTSVETLLSAGLNSRHLLFERGELSLLCPTAEESCAAAVASADELAARGWGSDKVLGPMVRQIAERQVERRPFLRMLDKRRFQPFDVVWAAGEVSEDDDVDRALRAEFDRWRAEVTRAGELARELMRCVTPEVRETLNAVVRDSKIVANTAVSDRWVRHFPMEPLSPAPWVYHLKYRVTERANQLAAPIVAQSGRLELEVLASRYWVAEDRRLEPIVWQPHREQPTPLRDLGFGIRTWAAIAVIEAATEQRHTPLPHLEAAQRLAREASRRTSSDESPSPVPITHEVGARQRLLIVDEPEQHLHPRAQRQVAGWLAERAHERVTLLATHALPFLDMPSPNAAYALVTRNADGVTRAMDISDDTFGLLELMSEEAGLAGRVEALQTIRAICLVEGAHDEAVLHHFYGHELARRRVLVVAVRGAKNVNAIIDAPWLSRMGAPLVILFDGVRASQVTKRRRPPGSNVAARAVWDLLAHWPRATPPPHVANFGLPDIFRALPAKCLQRAVRAADGRFPGWERIDRTFAKKPALGFKKVVLRESGLASDTDLDGLLGRALESCRTRPHQALEAALRTVVETAQMSAQIGRETWAPADSGPDDDIPF